MRPLLVLLVLLAAGLAGCMGEADLQQRPAGQIDGAVVDQYMNPYGEAEVELVGQERIDVTNDLGGFTFHGVPPGEHTVRVVFPDGQDEQTVQVVADEVTPTILQVPRVYEQAPHVSMLRHEGRVDLGLPGQGCASCSWTAELSGRPDHVLLSARWEDRVADDAPTSTLLRVELRDDDGRLITAVEGESPLQRMVGGHLVPAGADRLEVRVLFHEDNELPHPGFRMQSELCLYYGTDPATDRAC